MQRFNKLNKDSLILGVGSGKEKIIFHLANSSIAHVYATDLYKARGWEEALVDFVSSPEKCSKQEYSREKLTVMNMDGRKLSFGSEIFDVVFSFSSIEHVGGDRHWGL